MARDAGLGEVEIWTVDGRWFAAIASGQACPERTVMSVVTECLQPGPQLTPPADQMAPYAA